MSQEEEEVKGALECSICLEICQLPVQQCKNGHNICHIHLSQLKNCPTCREPYSGGCVRNLLAEKLILKMKKELEEQMKKKEQQNKENVVAVQKSVVHPQLSSSIVKNSGCQYFSRGQGQGSSGVGCSFQGGLSSVVQRHEVNSGFPPIKCCLATKGCNNALIPFSDYLDHLRDFHEVESFRGGSHVHNYYLKDSHQLVRNRPSSIFIMETLQQNFVILTKQIAEKIFVVVSIHGEGVNNGTEFFSKIEVLPKTNTVNDKKADLAFVKIEPITCTTRSLWNLPGLVLREQHNYLSISVVDVKKTIHARKYFSVKVTITTDVCLEGDKIIPVWPTEAEPPQRAPELNTARDTDNIQRLRFEIEQSRRSLKSPTLCCIL